MQEPEISSYASDGDDIDSTLASSKLDSQSLSLQTVDGSKRSVSEWVKYAQAMLQTPQKSTDRRARTPEDSAKKRRKFQRSEHAGCLFGGLHQLGVTLSLYVYVLHITVPKHSNSSLKHWLCPNTLCTLKGILHFYLKSGPL